MLAITDTVEKWFKLHPDEPLSTGFAYMFKALEVADGKSPEIIRRDISRIRESLKHWVIGYQVLKDSEDTESIDDAVAKVQNPKKPKLSLFGLFVALRKELFSKNINPRSLLLRYLEVHG